MKSSGVERWLVIPDVHAPYHDRAAWNCVKQAIAIVKPTGFVNLGDFAEGESVSHWQWKKKKRPPLDYQLKDIDVEIGELNRLMDDIDKVLDKYKVKKRVYIQGNHDEWFDRLVEENPHLVNTRHAYGDGYLFKDLLRLKERGYTFVPIGEMYKVGHLYIYHGHHCRSSISHARWHCLNKGVNVIYGHFHDVQNATISHVDGKKGAWSLGCLKGFKHDDGNQWLGRRGHNWSHAFGIVTFHNNGDFNVDTIMIINGRCTVWGQLIDGNKGTK